MPACLGNEVRAPQNSDCQRLHRKAAIYQTPAFPTATCWTYGVSPCDDHGVARPQHAPPHASPGQSASAKTQHACPGKHPPPTASGSQTLRCDALPCDAHAYAASQQTNGQCCGRCDQHGQHRCRCARHHAAPPPPAPLLRRPRLLPGRSPHASDGDPSASSHACDACGAARPQTPQPPPHTSALGRLCPWRCQ